MHRTLIYISGPITGHSDYKQKFAAVETMLQGIGYKVINPARIELSQETSWEEFMEIDFYLLSLCDEIFMLDGWEESRGASAEWGYAKAMGIDIREEAEWVG